MNRISEDQRQATLGFLGDMRDTIDQALIPRMRGVSEKICIVDAPHHSNIGDTTILLGEMAFINKNFPDASVSFVDWTDNRDYIDSLLKECSIIMFHGGGNFGSLWPHHHGFRLEIMQKFCEKPQIQFPQSIEFSDADCLQKTSEVLSSLQNFCLIVRDTTSEEFAKNSFNCDIALCPDMALYLPMTKAARPIAACCSILRNDKERSVNHTALKLFLNDNFDSYVDADWLTIRPTPTFRLDQFLSKGKRRLGAHAKALSPAWRELRLAMAQSQFNLGMALLSRGQVLVTDRLHAHIMAILGGISHAFFDTAGGKISALNRTWTSSIPYATHMSSIEDLSQWDQIAIQNCHTS